MLERYETALPVSRCCQTNANSTLLGQRDCPLSSAEFAPLGKSGAVCQFKFYT